MRKAIKIPRILKINWIKGITISVVFNNGESRIIDFQKVFKGIELQKESPAWKLNNPKEFEKVSIDNNTLSWTNVNQYIKKIDGSKKKVPFEIGADVLLKYSTAEKSELMLEIGKLIKESRLKSGLTQQELAIKSGTTRTYISRIENERSDIELGTLKKIIETGLGKKMDILIK
ncbi:MAG TPA: helix-turn-helix transcriptional regulator [Bacteroidales bacterium]|nr:helix-turn-helix transcriptional regulator [Bacteroidales bacterium]